MEITNFRAQFEELSMHGLAVFQEYFNISVSGEVKYHPSGILSKALSTECNIMLCFMTHKVSSKS